MGSKKWPQEAVDWLKENAKGKNTADITEQLNRQGFDVKYGIIFTESQVKAAKSRYKIKSGVAGGVPKGYSFKFPPGMEEYIRSRAKGRSVREIAGMVSEHFGIEFTASQCSGYKKAHNIRSGNKQTFPKGNIPHNKGKHMPPEIYEKCKQTMFKKGHTPANKMQVGEYTHTTDGYLKVKVQDEGTQNERFMFVHRKVWEEHNGPILPGHKIIFLDGNKDNCDISNLAMVDNAEALEMYRRNLRTDDTELTRTGLVVAKINIAARKRKRGEK